MGFTAKRRAYLVDALGEDAVRRLEDATKGMADQLHDRGIEFKGSDEQGGHGNFGALLDRAGGRGDLADLRKLAALTGSSPKASAWASTADSDVTWVREVFGDPYAARLEPMVPDRIDAMIDQIIREIAPL